MFYLLWEQEIMMEEKIFDSLHAEVVRALREIRNGNWDDSRRELYCSMRLLDKDLHAQLFQTFDEDTRKNLSAFFSSDVTVEKLLRPDKRVGTNSLLSFRRSVYEDVTTDVTTAFANALRSDLQQPEIADNATPVFAATFLQITPMDDCELVAGTESLMFTDFPAVVEIPGICSLFLRFVTFGTGAHYTGMLFLHVGRWLFFRRPRNTTRPC